MQNFFKIILCPPRNNILPLEHIHSKTKRCSQVTSSYIQRKVEHLFFLYFLLFKAATVFSTWAKRCDKVVFITDEDDEELPVINVNMTGREKLWGKTRRGLHESYRQFGAHVDWVLKVLNWIA